MELRQLRYFVALAEERNFTRAAARLHITQPPLSQQIKLLEEELGVLLFKREPRGVTLTDAGRTLLGHARSVTEGVKVAVHETRATASGRSGSMRIGVINSAMFSVMPHILRRLRRGFAGLDLSVQELGSHGQIQALLRGEIDLGIAHMNYPTAGVRAEKWRTEPLCAVVPASHPLAGKRAIPLAALADADFVFATREAAPVTFDQMIATCIRAGFSPRIRHTASHLATIVQMVAMELGVALVPRSQRLHAPRTVRFLALGDPAARIELFVVHRDPGLSELSIAVKDAILRMPLRGA